MAHDAPFSIPNPWVARPAGRAAELPLRVAEWSLGLTRLNGLYARWRASPTCEPRAFIDAALDLLGTGYDVDPPALERIPVCGPLIVVANHPHGALDGLVLASLLFRRRPDVRLLGNVLLARIPELRPFCVFVDPFGDAARRNSTGMRGALAWVRDGGALVVFPAGEVAHATAIAAPVADPPWNPAVARLAGHGQATVLPAWIDGTNSRLFQMAGLVHPRLRTALLPRELLKQRGRRVAVAVGEAIPWSRLDALPSAAARIDYLRLRTENLRVRGNLRVRDACRSGQPPGGRPAVALAPVPIAAAVNPATLAAEVAVLGPERMLVAHGDFRVFVARAGDIPQVLREIGRLREETFRAAGEGTGTAIDLDRYDRRYRHLFVWNDARREVAGAYRIAPTDDLGATRRPGRLYTRSLFRFGRAFCSRLGPALELGRSFVRAEYQRDYGTLALLWKGIGRFVARAPRYRYLFGPVSVSAVYGDAARELIVTTLSGPRFRSPLAALVEPKRPVGGRVGALATVCGAPDQLDRMLRELTGGRAMPVLLRQYLKLNARFLGFSVDPAFGHALDGLAIVDLLDVDPSILQRYMTSEGVAAFRGHHRAAWVAPPDGRPAAVPVGMGW